MRPLQGRPLWFVAVVLFTLGIFNESPWHGLRDSPRVELMSEPLRAAENLLRTGAIANPFGPLDTGPTAHVSPIWAFIQFLALKAFGMGAAGWLAIRALPVILLSLEYGLLPWAARALGFTAWNGVAAAVFGLLTKPGREERCEAHLAGLTILLLTTAAIRCQRRPLVTGVLAGFGMLVQPVILPPYFAWVLLTARRNLTLWIAPLLVIAPWIVRNQIQLGAPFALRDNLGLELYVSFSDCAPYGLRENYDNRCMTPLHPNSSTPESEAVRDMGEYAYNQDRQRRALGWMAQHPQRTLSLIAQRTWFFWFPTTHGVQSYLTQRKRTWPLHALTVASFVGLYLAFRSRVASAKLLGLWLLLYPPIYYIVQFEERYRYPILWITWLLAAYAFAHLVRKRAA